MIGLGWRAARFGDRLTVDGPARSVVLRRATALDPVTSAAPIGSSCPDADHPITRGMPAEWMTPRTSFITVAEPAENMEILATACSAKEKGGTGTNEPMIWMIQFGKGRVFTTVMGMSWGRTLAIRCNGFRTVLFAGPRWPPKAT